MYDSSTIKDAPQVKPGQKAIALNSGDIAEEFGNLKCANAVMLGAIGAMLTKYYLTPADAAKFQETAAAAIAECFEGKAKVIAMNTEACKLGFDKMQALLS